MIASLGMYDLPPLQAANDRYWALIRDSLRDRGLPAPEALTRGEAAYWPAWQAADLVLSHTCGYPFRTRLHGRVTLVGTPDFAVTDCPAGHYCSVFVARAEDDRADLAALSRGRFAYNEGLSQSGWAAAQTHAGALGLTLRPGLQTGGHQASMRAVASGKADLAALDAVTWVLLQRHDPQAQRLRAVARTAPTPGLPYIAALGADADALRAAIAQAIEALTPEDRHALMLTGLAVISADAYLAVPNPPAPDQIAQAN